MDTFRAPGARTPREAPRVGDYRRGSRVRTTRAGTWFPAVSAEDEPAGLLLLHPAVKQGVLTDVIGRLAELGSPGVLPMLPGLVEQAGRNWLVATATPTPTVADLLDDAGYGTPANATALAAAIATTLLDVHAAGLAHGAVGAQAIVLAPDGGPMLADWGLDEHATPRGDVVAWAELAGLLAARWCEDSPADAALLGRAVDAAGSAGPRGGLAGALAVLTRSQRPPAVEEPAAEPRAARPTPRPRPAPAEQASAPAEQASAPAEQASAPVIEPPAPVPASGSGLRPPAEQPAPARSGRPRGFARPALLTVLLTVVLVTAVAMIIRPFDTNAAPAAPTGPMEVRAVSVDAQMRQSICVLAGTVTTNGQPGRLVYRWVGESGSQAVASVSTAGYNYQVEIGLIWSPSSPPLHGSSVTLQILEPQPSTTSVLLPIGCI